MSNEIITEKHGQALVVIFNRPDCGNAFNTEMANQLFHVLKPVTTSPGIRAVMLRGANGTFLQGLDLRLFHGDFNRALENGNQLIQPYHSAIRELNAMDKPVLSAVNGEVSGPGMSLMLASDLVIAARSTKFNCRYTTYGLPPDGGASFHLARKVGSGRAMELLMLSETFSAEDALKWGLINTVVDDDELPNAALTLLDKLANGPTRAYAGVKRVVSKAFEQDLVTHLGLEHTYWGGASRSFDFRDAIKAHQAKLPVKFTGA